MRKHFALSVVINISCTTMKYSITSTKAFISFLLITAVLTVSLPLVYSEENTEVPASVTQMTEMEILIKSLMEQIKVLQAQVLELQKRQGNTFSVDKKPAIAERKEFDVEVLENLRVRSEAGIGMAMVAVKQRGMRGVVIDGPVERGGMKWYKIKYSDGTQGWSAGDWLRLTERSKEIKDETKEKLEDYIKDKKDKEETDSVVCTLDAFQCPNGDIVGRTGPKCQFICPVTEALSNTE